MAQKILIDLSMYHLTKGESYDHSPPEGLYYNSTNENGLKTLRELAVFRFTCRRCTDSPCISVCPSEALEKDQEGMITRSTNLCVACKSCVTICPFGTMMTDFFIHHRNKENYFDLKNDKELEKFIQNSPEGAVKIVEMNEDPAQNIYELNENVLIKEFCWDSDKY